MSALRLGMRALVVTGLVIAAALAAVLSLAGTEVGSSWAVQSVLARAPGVTVARVRGSLLGGLVLEGVRVRSPSDELDIARLTLDWDAAAALGGTLAFRGAEATTAEYRRTPGAPGSAGAPPRLPFAIRVEAATLDALTMDVAGTRTSFGPTAVAASLDGSRLSIPRLTTSTQGFVLDADADLDLGDAVRVRAGVRWSGEIGGNAAAGNLALEGTWPALLVTHDLTAPFAAHAEGTLDLAGEPHAEVALEWSNFAWPGFGLLASQSGRMTLSGTLADYRYEGSGMLDIEQRHAATFAVRGTGSRAALVLERLELDARDANASAGVLVATGSADLAARTATVAVTATGANPAWWDAAWPGTLRGTGTVRAQASPMSVAFDGLDVAGTLRGYAVSLRGAAEYREQGSWRLAGVRLQSGDNRVAVDGALAATGLDLDADVDVRNLDVLWPGLRGAATGNVTIGGSFAQPTGRGRLSGSKLAYRDFSIEKVVAEGSVGGAANAPLSLKLEVDGLARGSVRIDQLRGAASGTTAAHRVTLDFDGREWHAQAAANGAFAAATWRGTLEQAVFDEDLLGRWQLGEPAAVTIGARETVLATTCLEHPSGGRWCGQLELRGRPTDRVVLAAQNFELKTLRPLLPPALVLEGVYQLSGSLFDPTGNPRGALVLTGERTHVRASTGVQQTYDTDLDELQAAATLNNGRLALQAALRSGDAGKIDVTASIRDVRQKDSAIDGRLDAAWPDIGFLALLAPELGQLGGGVTGQLTIGGSVEEPAVDGRLGWQGGRVSVPEWGLVVDGIEANAASRGGRALTFDAKGRIGDGEVTLTGDTALDPEAGWPTRLALRGTRIRAVQIPEAEIYVTPSLDAVVTWPDVRVTGTVEVPRAMLGLSALPAQAVAPSADAVVHGRKDAGGAHRLRLHAAIDMKLGDDVHYSGLDLDTKVTGSLHVDAEPDRTAVGMGTLTLAGTYNAYGQELMLERGQLLFSGPLDDPGVDVRAVRTIDTTKVGVELVGTVKSPRTRVFSTPSMSEADALSYLLFGRPMTGSGTQESATLETAAIAMGLNQALPVVRRLGSTLGLDELSVQTTATDAGALMAGKYLSPKLYIRYSYGLFNRIGGLLLRFKFNERLSIETRSGDQKSMDLLYTVEKD